MLSYENTAGASISALIAESFLSSTRTLRVTDFVSLLNVTVAVIFASPSPTALRTPFSIFATASVSEEYSTEISLPVAIVPSEKYAEAESNFSLPVIISSFSVRFISAFSYTSSSTYISIESVYSMPSIVVFAVMVTSPFETPFIFPSCETVATLVFPLSKVTLSPSKSTSSPVFVIYLAKISVSIPTSAVSALWESSISASETSFSSILRSGR